MNKYKNRVIEKINRQCIILFHGKYLIILRMRADFLVGICDLDALRLG